MRLIDADVLLKQSRRVVEYDEAGFSMEYNAVPTEEIKNAPTVEAVPVVRGEWLKRVKNNGGYVASITCSVCGYSHSRVTYNFCPECGADMRKGGANNV